MKSALSRYTPQDFIALVDRYGIAHHEKTLGQLFCDGSARQIVDMLMAECAAAGFEVALGGAIREVKALEGGGPRFRVAFGNRTVTADALVVATGGASIPKMGATGFAYDLARQFRLKVVEPRPALVPLTLGGNEILFRDLSGVSANVVARCGKVAFREAALFTHRGLSGPAILQISSYWRHGNRRRDRLPAGMRRPVAAGGETRPVQGSHAQRARNPPSRPPGGDARGPDRHRRRARQRARPQAAGRRDAAVALVRSRRTAARASTRPR